MYHSFDALRPQLTIATAIVFFHRFFVSHSLKDYDPYVINPQLHLFLHYFSHLFLQTIATTSLFLAGKVEETPKKLRDVILITHRIRFKNREDLKPESQVINYTLLFIPTFF